MCAFLGALIASRRKASLGGFVLGLLFGPLGVVAAFALDGRDQCPKCGTRLDSNGEICPSCKTELAWRIFGPTVVPERTQQAMGNDEVGVVRVNFRCGSCQKQLTWPAYDAGRKIPCTDCGAPTMVPDFDPLATKAPTSKSKTVSEVRLTKCPDCNKQISKRAQMCPHCGCPVNIKE